MNKLKQYTLALGILALVLTVTMAACENRPSPNAAPPQVNNPASVIEGNAVASSRIWPPAPAEPVAIEKDLLARNYYLILDASGSMAGDKIKEAKKAIIEFALQVVPPDANIALMVFQGSHKDELIPLGKASRGQVVSKVQEIRADGGTPLWDTLALVYQKLTRQAQAQLGYGEYHLVIVTDGEDTASSQYTDRIVNRILEESPIVIHTIGYHIAKHSLNQPGRIVYVEANNLGELRKGLKAVVAESETFDLTSFSDQ